MAEAAYALNEPAPSLDIERLRQRCPKLPTDYFAFLSRSNGGEGFVGISPGYFQLWPAHEIDLSTYELNVYLPGYIAVGSNGGGELYVFATEGIPAGFFMVPAVGMKPDTLRLVTSTFEEFVNAFGGE